MVVGRVSWKENKVAYVFVDKSHAPQVGVGLPEPCLDFGLVPEVFFFKPDSLIGEDAMRKVLSHLGALTKLTRGIRKEIEGGGKIIRGGQRVGRVTIHGAQALR